MATKKKAAKKKTAAKKGKSKSKALATTTKNKAVANYKERLSTMAKADSTRGHSMGDSNYISTQGGEFSFQGEIFPEPEFNAIIIDFAYENAYYDSIFDPDNPAPPACFAIADDPDELVAHESSPDMQGAEGNVCEGCELNEFATSNTGKGKACKNGVRLALVNADNMGLVNASSEPAFLRLAPTSLKHFEKYKDKITRVTGQPLLACVTKLELTPNKTWHEVHFSHVEQIEDEQMLQNMLSVHDTYADILREPYDVSNYGAEKPSPRRGKKASSKKKVAKKKAAKKKSARAAKY